LTRTGLSELPISPNCSAIGDCARDALPTGQRRHAAQK
jgi:hypothetical protein